MRRVLIYTTPICPFCTRAKALLQKKGADFEEIDIYGNAGARADMEAKASGRRTVPQIFVGDTYVGGCDDLFELEAEGRLDPLLAGDAS